jgi:hypothetical protein
MPQRVVVFFSTQWAFLIVELNTYTVLWTCKNVCSLHRFLLQMWNTITKLFLNIHRAYNKPPILCSTFCIFHDFMYFLYNPGQMPIRMCQCFWILQHFRLYPQNVKLVFYCIPNHHFSTLYHPDTAQCHLLYIIVIKQWRISGLWYKTSLYHQITCPGGKKCRQKWIKVLIHIYIYI